MAEPAAVGPAVDPDDEALPPALEQPPAGADWPIPTPWLLGAKLFGALRDIAISKLFDFNPQDWMSGDAPIDLTQLADGEACWIDYLSDTGDSPQLVYRLARLLQQPALTLPGLAAPLPQGAVLVLGGDTAYPIATRRQLLERMRAPFLWARRSLRAAGALSPRRPVLLGVAGNHDYYNALAGYERFFHARPGGPGAPVDRVAPAGYERRQRASYFAALLPFGWQLWGLDIEVRDVDALQAAYFARARAAATGPVKRIIASSRPAMVNGALSPVIDELEHRLAQVDVRGGFSTSGAIAPDELRLDLAGDYHLYERYWGADAWGTRYSSLDQINAGESVTMLARTATESMPRPWGLGTAGTRAMLADGATGAPCAPVRARTA